MKGAKRQTRFTAEKLDIEQCILFTQRITRLQARVRGKQVLSRLEGVIAEMREKIQFERMANPDEVAIKEFVTQLKAKKMTPEAFFRVCDSQYRREISEDDFRAGIKMIGLKLTELQLQRIMLILDEDMGGTVSLAEYQNALESLGASREKHINADPNSRSTTYIPFQLRVVKEIVDMLEEKKITPVQLFNNADKIKKGTIKIEQLKDLIAQKDPNIQVKKLHAIYKYLDDNGDGLLTKQEFIHKIEQAQKLISRKDKNALEEFEEEQIAAGDQSMGASIVPSKKPVAKPAVGSKSIKPQSAASTRPNTAQTVKKAVVAKEPLKSKVVADESEVEEQEASQSENQEPVNKYSNYDTQDCIREIEKITKEPIQVMYLDQFADEEQLNNQTFIQIAAKRGKALPQQLVEQLMISCDKDSKNSVRVATLVRILESMPGRLKMQPTFYQKLAEQIKAPAKQTLLKLFPQAEYGILKKDFMDKFGRILQKVDLVVGFHNMSTYANGHEQINIKKFLEKIAPFVKQDDAVLIKVDSSRKNQLDQTLKNDSQISQEINSMLWTDLDQARKEFKNFDYDPAANANGCLESNTNVIQSMICFYKLSELVVNTEFIQKLIDKVDNWLESNDGNNEDSATSYLNEKFKKIIEETEKLTELNTYMVRAALSEIKEKESDNLFEPLELLTIQILLADIDGFNEMEIDQDYLKEFIRVPDDDDKEQVAEYIKECEDRLKERAYMCKTVMREAIVTKSSDFDITNDRVWEKIRFGKIATLLIKKLQQPELKQMLLDAFKNDPNYLISYYDLDQLVDDRIKIDAGEEEIPDFLYNDWMFCLDAEDEAYVSLKSIANWLSIYGYDLGVPVEQSNTTSTRQRKKNQDSPATYQITDADYFRNCKTILNSEVAALAEAERYFNQCERSGELWDDPDFGPTEDDPHGAKSLYYTGETPRGHVEVEEITWERPEVYLARDEEKPETGFVKGDAAANEVKQGKLGNCWFISALSVIAGRDELIRGDAGLCDKENLHLLDKQMVSACCIGVFPPIFHKFRTQGIYVLRFFKNYRWRYVIIDSKLPIFGFQNVFVSCNDQEELWAPLIEKAYAKLFGCYEALRSGNIDEGLVDMSGFVCEKIQLQDQNGKFLFDKEELWKRFENYFQDECLMGCSRSGGTEHELMIDGEDTGIKTGHAYGFNKVFELNDQEMANPRKTHRLCVIRNPWGHTEWKLKWGSHSEQLIQHADKIQKQYIDELEEEEKFDMNEDDGLFFMNYKSFREVFNKLFVAVDFDDKWSAVRYYQNWTKETSGGLPSKSDPSSYKRYATSPQYFISSTEDCEIFVSLGQRDGRIVGYDGKYESYPFKARLNPTYLAIWQIGDTETKLEQWVDEKTNAKASKLPALYATASKLPARVAEQSLRVKLLKNKRYILVPSTLAAGTEGEFFLSIYTDCEMAQFNLYRVGKPEERYSWIAEEFDKSERSIPKWKVDWVRQQIAEGHVIVKDDVDTTNKKKKKSSK